MSTRILFGAVAFCRVTQTEADATLELAFSNRVNRVDVSVSYGEAKLHVGDWIKRHGRSFFLATKTGERTAAKAQEEIHRSLEHLQVDQVASSPRCIGRGRTRYAHVPPTPLTLEEAAEEVINAMAEKDLATVAEFIHPEQGVRFSTYTYVRDSHQVFAADELSGQIGSEEIFLWGYFDDTGDPIELTFDDYYERFIYSADFANPEQMAVDQELGFGNTINNIADFYPGSSFVEYHFSEFVEDYGGMDWVSLRLALSKKIVPCSS